MNKHLRMGCHWRQLTRGLLSFLSALTVYRFQYHQEGNSYFYGRLQNKDNGILYLQNEVFAHWHSCWQPPRRIHWALRFHVGLLAFYCYPFPRLDHTLGCDHHGAHATCLLLSWCAYTCINQSIHVRYMIWFNLMDEEACMVHEDN